MGIHAGLRRPVPRTRRPRLSWAPHAGPGTGWLMWLTQLTSQAPRALPTECVEWSSFGLTRPRFPPSFHRAVRKLQGAAPPPSREISAQRPAPSLQPCPPRVELISAAPSAVALQSCPAALRQAAERGLGVRFPRSSPQGNPSFREHAAPEGVPSPPSPSAAAIGTFLGKVLAQHHAPPALKSTAALRWP